MRPPPPLPLLLTLVASALPALAQVRTGSVAADAASGTGQVGTSLNGGVAPVTLGGGSLAPLSLNGSLSPKLAAPAVSPGQGLAPSALTPSKTVAAASADSSLPKAAAAAALPPNGPPGKGPQSAPAGGPPSGPPFLEVLKSLGVPEDALAELAALATPAATRFADATTAMSKDEKASKRVLLILSAALRDADPFASVPLAERVGARFGFDDKQVIALGQPELYADASEAFPLADRAWAKSWTSRLKLAERAALEAARVREKMSSTTSAMAKALRESADFGLLPDDIKAALTEGGLPSRGPADGEPGREAGGAAGERGPPADPRAVRDAAAVRKYIAEIFGKRVPTEREMDALLGDWLTEHEIPVDSKRHRAVRALLLPDKTGAESKAFQSLPEGLRPRGPLLARLAEQHGTTVEALAAMLQRRGLLKTAETLDAESLERQVFLGLESEELKAAVKDYPETEAGELMRGVASTMSAKGGKSVEEIARDGVFVYSDFAGGRPSRSIASRDPDIKTFAMVFYVTRRDGKWRFDGYRQNKRTGSSDMELIRLMKAWLVAGGVPVADLL